MNTSEIQQYRLWQPVHPKKSVPSLLPKHHEVLDHLFPQVVIYTVDLVLCKQGRKVGWQFLWTLEVTTKGLLDNYPVPTSATKTVD